MFSDRKCIAEKMVSGDGDGAPPTLYSPASALACRRPATCIVGGYTNFVSMIASGIATESCFP